MFSNDQLRENTGNEEILKEKLLECGWVVLDSVAIGLDELDCKIYNLINGELISQGRIFGYCELIAFSSMVQADTGTKYLFVDGEKNKYIVIEDDVFSILDVSLSQFYDTENETYSIQLKCNKDHTGEKPFGKVLYSCKDKLTAQKLAEKISFLINKKLEAR